MYHSMDLQELKYSIEEHIRLLTCGILKNTYRVTKKPLPFFHIKPDNENKNIYI